MQAMPAHNPILGHLLFASKLTSSLPDDAHGHYLPDLIRRADPDLGPIYYLDNWPFSPPILVVTSPKTAYQITQERSLMKFRGMRTFLRPLTGEHDLVTMEGQIWKTWRGIFNHGFSASHIMTLVPAIVGEAMVFYDILQERAKRGEIFKLKVAMDNLTLDIIGKLVLCESMVYELQSCSNSTYLGTSI